MSEFEDKLNSILSDPGRMARIADMAKSLMGGDAESGAEPQRQEENPPDSGDFFSGGLDLGSIAKISKILSEVKQENDDKTQLLRAMEPYLKPQRREKMEKGVKLAKLARIAKLALGELGGLEDV